MLLICIHTLEGGILAKLGSFNLTYVKKKKCLRRGPKRTEEPMKGLASREKQVSPFSLKKKLTRDSGEAWQRRT